MINTGIHSKKKYNNEPFRWAGESCSDYCRDGDSDLYEACANGNYAGDWPVKNHMFNGTDVSTSLGALELTTFGTVFSQSTRKPHLSL